MNKTQESKFWALFGSYREQSPDIDSAICLQVMTTLADRLWLLGNKRSIGKRILLVAAALSIQACTTTDPGDGAGITYRLPRTDAKVTLGIDVVECQPLKVDATLKIDAVASAQDGYIHISGAELSSQVTKRALTIDVDDSNVIASVNSTSTDQSSIILGNVVKLGASVAGAVLGGQEQQTDVAQVICNPTTVQNVTTLKKLQSALDSAVLKLSTASNPSNQQKTVDTLTSAVATAKTKVHRDVTATIKLESVIRDQPYQVPFDDSAVHILSELFSTSYWNPKNKHDSKTVNADSIQLFSLTAIAAQQPAMQDGMDGDKPSTPSACAQSIVVPSAKAVTLTVTASGSVINQGQTKSATQSMYASQIGENGRLCISAGFGENRVVGLKFDKFGRATELSWTADARAANVSSALAGSSSDASTIVTQLKNVDLTREKATLDQASTENSLQLARICKAVLDAGGTSCPK